MDEDSENLEQIRAQKGRKMMEESRKRAQQEEQIRGAMAQLLEPEAYSRLMFIKQNNPQLFVQAVQTIAYLSQSGKIASRINEKQMLSLLAKIAPPKRETKITFMRKGGDEGNIGGENK